MHLEVGNKSNFIYINSKDIVDFNNNKSSSKQIYKYKIHSYTHLHRFLIDPSPLSVGLSSETHSIVLPFIVVTAPPLLHQYSTISSSSPQKLENPPAFTDSGCSVKAKTKHPAAQQNRQSNRRPCIRTGKAQTTFHRVFPVPLRTQPRHRPH